jgi:hypothetical protein
MAKKLWSEDDCTRGTPGHEYVGAAWKRLFGTEFDCKAWDVEIDHGDCIERQFGHISVWNVYGAWYEIIDNSQE